MEPTLLAKRERLLGILRELRRVIVALSGGIDSTVVAQAAFLALGDEALAVTADSPSVARRDIDDARRLAAHIGIRHRIIATDEFADPSYVANDGARCYFCKSALYDRLALLRSEFPNAVICSGANLDDQGDYRPGLRAAAERAIRHPLQEAGCTKADVRALARAWGLPTWEKPASPCLASRLAPGVEVTPERTARIEAAESLLHELGLRECRVRLHHGELARIEVPCSALAKLVDDKVRRRLTARLREFGFRYVTLDLEGFRSGSLNDLVDLTIKQRFAP